MAEGGEKERVCVCMSQKVRVCVCVCVFYCNYVHFISIVQVFGMPR